MVTPEAPPGVKVQSVGKELHTVEEIPLAGNEGHHTGALENLESPYFTRITLPNGMILDTASFGRETKKGVKLFFLSISILLPDIDSFDESCTTEGVCGPVVVDGGSYSVEKYTEEEIQALHSLWTVVDPNEELFSDEECPSPEDYDTTTPEDYDTTPITDPDREKCEEACDDVDVVEDCLVRN